MYIGRIHELFCSCVFLYFKNNVYHMTRGHYETPPCMTSTLRACISLLYIIYKILNAAKVLLATQTIQ